MLNQKGRFFIFSSGAILTLIISSSFLRTPPPNSPYIDPIEEARNAPSSSGFTLTSSVVAEGGVFPKEYTCDGKSVSPPIAWIKEPAATKSFAVIMQHIAGPNDVHWYWVVHHIPIATHEITAGDKTIGIIGGNSTNPDAAYAPPCSKGPGPKRYSITVYALSAEPTLSKPIVNRSELLDAIKNLTLDQARLNFVYAR